MAATLALYMAPVQALNRRLKVGGGMLALVVLGEGLLAYLRPFA
jgi:hypothetical protein